MDQIEQEKLKYNEGIYDRTNVFLINQIKPILSYLPSNLQEFIED